MSTANAMAWKDSDLNTLEKRGKHAVAVISCGRTGLSTACLLAEAGFQTIVADSDQYLTSLIKKGKAAFADQEISRIVTKHVKTGHFTATNQVKEATSKSDVLVIAVLVTLDEKKKPDYSRLEKVCKEMGMGLRSGSLVVVEGTVGPGVTETLVKEALEKASGLNAETDFGLAYCPVNASHDTLKYLAVLPRIVGALNESSLKTACLVLRCIAKTQILAVRNIRTAEATGLFESIHEDVNHALSTELAHFCEKAGIDFPECQKTVSAHLPCSLSIPNATRGYFSPEPYLFFEGAESADVRLRLVTEARRMNEEMLNRAVHMTKDALKSCGKAFRRARITVLGVSGRTNVKEKDHYFSKNLVAALSKNGVRARVYDPFFSVKELVEFGYSVEATLGKSVEGADCLLVVVGHDRFKRLNLRRIKFLMKQPAAIVDLCNVIDSVQARKEGFIYRGFGRG
jgi:nucleotide sugar dehydrogenase